MAQRHHPNEYTAEELMILGYCAAAGVHRFGPCFVENDIDLEGVKKFIDALLTSIEAEMFGTTTKQEA